MNDKLFGYAFYIIFIVGIIGHSIPGLRSLMISITPFTLFITYILYLLGIKHIINKQAVIWAASVFILTFLLEVIGVKYGIIFGNYDYGNVLGLKLLGVPLIIGMNWVLIILGAVLISSKIADSNLLVPIFAGIIAVFFDVVLEIVAVELGYWNWMNNQIPLENYTAWFLITAAAALLYRLLKIKIESTIPVHYLLAQYLFFVSLFFVFM